MQDMTKYLERIMYGHIFTILQLIQLDAGAFHSAQKVKLILQETYKLKELRNFAQRTQ